MSIPIYLVGVASRLNDHQTNGWGASGHCPRYAGASAAAPRTASTTGRRLVAFATCGGARSRRGRREPMIGA